MLDVNKSRNWVRTIWELPILSLQLFCKSKVSKINIKKKKTPQQRLGADGIKVAF